LPSVVHDGDISLDDVIAVARVMRERSMSRYFSGTVKEILGSCQSVGCTVNGQPPRDLQKQITDGDVEIPEE